MKFKMQRKIILPLVVIGMLFGIICTAGCITGTDSYSANDIVGKWYFESDGLTIEFKDDNVAIWHYQKHPTSDSCKWKYLGSGIYYAWRHSGDLGAFYLDGDTLYGGSYHVLIKESGPKNSIVGTWTADPSFSTKHNGDVYTLTINNDLSFTSDSSYPRHGQLIGTGKNNERHQLSGWAEGMGFVSNTNYMISLFGDDVAAKRI